MSSVPPVWPSPRPEIIGTGTPQAAARGARISDTLSPTPPVECLSTLMPGRVREVQHLAGLEHRRVHAPSSSGVEPAEEDGHHIADIW